MFVFHQAALHKSCDKLINGESFGGLTVMGIEHLSLLPARV